MSHQFSVIVEIRASHGHQRLVKVSPEVPAIPNPLNMSAPQGVAGGVIIRRNIDAGGFPDHPWSGEADARTADGKLIG